MYLSSSSGGGNGGVGASVDADDVKRELETVQLEQKKQLLADQQRQQQAQQQAKQTRASRFGYTAPPSSAPPRPSSSYSQDPSNAGSSRGRPDKPQPQRRQGASFDYSKYAFDISDDDDDDDDDDDVQSNFFQAISYHWHCL